MAATTATFFNLSNKKILITPKFIHTINFIEYSSTLVEYS